MAKRPFNLRPAVLALCMIAITSTLPAADVRVGIIGLDTSHAVEFTQRLNDPASTNFVPGARVIAALPAASPDIPASIERVEGFTATVRDKYGVRIVSDVKELVAAVDALMVLSIDGRAHVQQMKDIVAAKKPIFLDKPVAASLKDAVDIYKQAEAAETPVLSASVLRWNPSVLTVAAAGVANPSGAVASGPAPKMEHHSSLFFYGIHATEALFTVLGSGCTSVVNTVGSGAAVITGKWADGRLGTLYAMHTWPAPYQITVFGTEKVVSQSTEANDYTPLVREIVKFFESRTPPLSALQTLEIYAFMEAADESARKNGREVSLREVLEQAGCPVKWMPPLKKS